ncbi:ABC transporter substrate-binding protein [Streptomyces sp. NPDC055955]|uniref:ABC transporter substrate-binding protein n=1 Tax=Streptomyces sp. NPDC055955 TaxID=3345665 RepID=UPI0035D71B2D
MSPAPRSSLVGRRALLGLVGGAAASALLTACGSTTGTVAQPAGAVPARFGRRTRVVLWSTFADVPGKALQSLADRFNAEQKDIYVEVQFQGTYDECAQKAVVGLVAGQVPDLCVLSDVKWHKFYFGDALERWDGYLDPAWMGRTYQPKLLAEGRLKGYTWWLPLARSTPLFYYNRTLFQKAGVPDRAPKTWDELYAWSKDITRLKVKGKRVALEAYQKIDGDWMFQCSAWQWGGGYSDGLDVTIDHGGAVAAAEWQRRLVHRDRIAYMADSPTNDLANQLIATQVNSTGGLKMLTEAAKAGGWELGTGFLPRQEEFEVTTGGGGLSMFRRTSHERKQAAAEFVRFLARPENSAQWTVDTGYMPVVPAATKTPVLARLMKDDPNVNTAVRQLPLTRQGDQVRMMVPNANVQIYTGLQNIWSANVPAEKAFADVAERLRKNVDRHRDSIEEHL